ncbi:MAG: hypothetical protein ACK52I_13375 [Pseudomonadota bacterium]|jgi:hypothetical protein
MCEKRCDAGIAGADENKVEIYLNRLTQAREAIHELSAHRDGLAGEVLRLRAALKTIRFNLVGDGKGLPQSDGCVRYNALLALENIDQALAVEPHDYVEAAKAERQFLDAALAYADAKAEISVEENEYRRTLTALRCSRGMR